MATSPCRATCPVHDDLAEPCKTCHQRRMCAQGCFPLLRVYPESTDLALYSADEGSHAYLPVTHLGKRRSPLACCRYTQNTPLACASAVCKGDERLNNIKYRVPGNSSSLSIMLVPRVSVDILGAHLILVQDELCRRHGHAAHYYSCCSEGQHTATGCHNCSTKRSPGSHLLVRKRFSF